MVLIRPFPVPTEGIKLQLAGVEAFVDNEVHGKGNLFVTEANIAWVRSDSGDGFKIAYKKMTLHAISRDPGVHSKACLYIMINGNTLDEDDNFEVESPAEVEDGEEEMTEIRFVPEDESALDEMYKAVQDCSLLHPDPSSDLSNEDPDEMFEGFPAGNGDGNPQDEIAEEDEDFDEDAERLEQFMRMQLHFGNSRNGGSDNEDDNIGGGSPSLSFVPQPGQFDDI
ncbi:Methylosome subunit pICln [Orchesella cincta]|uniref:Methylosome subunit pICln n=1 Tax=Orchesella cincta TaxID=48709 RepID=A0A1D2N9F9_ORCCI|nr:Methylosome subunit pICln [Orchesella cincta]